MKGILYYLFTLFAFGFISCQQGGNANTVPADLVGFTTKEIAGGNAIKAVKNDAAGQILEEGILINGAKNGSWITYYPNKDKVIKTLANYVDNQLNGVYLTFTDRAQIETLTTYADGVFDGNYAKFRFGTLEESANYVNGQMEGVYKKYYPSRKIQIEATYKNGNQHGTYKYYDELGNVVMEYEYKDGEKVAGGMK